VGDLPPRRPPRDCSDQEFEDWLRAATERADPFMAWLGILFALLVGYDIAVDLGPRATLALAVASWAIWVVFAAELAVKLWIAPRRLRFLRRHWLQVLGLVVPWLRFLRFIRLLRAGRALPAARIVSSSYRSAGAARRLLQSRLGYLGASSVVVAVAVAELAYVFERDARDGVFTSFGDALLWSATAVVALQGDPTPSTTGARIAMLVAFAFGLVIVASLAGTVGAFLVDDRRERAEREGG
jgi:voltage-gated potassium channel